MSDGVIFSIIGLGVILFISLQLWFFIESKNEVVKESRADAKEPETLKKWVKFKDHLATLSDEKEADRKDKYAYPSRISLVFYYRGKQCALLNFNIDKDRWLKTNPDYWGRYNLWIEFEYEDNDGIFQIVRLTSKDHRYLQLSLDKPEVTL